MAHSTGKDFAKHSRPSVSACDQCSRRKLGCSKDTPRCQRCMEDGRMCTYSVHRGAGRPRKTSKQNTRQSSPSEIESNLMFPSLDAVTQVTTPSSETQLCSPLSFCEPTGMQPYMDLTYTANQDMGLNDFLPLQQDTHWIPENNFENIAYQTPSNSCGCIRSILSALQNMTSLALFNGTTSLISYETVELIRSSYSACERMILCPHIHQSARIMLLLAVVQHIDDILHRMTTLSKEECKAAMWAQDQQSGGEAVSFLTRSDLMRGVLILAAAKFMDQAEYGFAKDSLRPMGLLQQYIVQLQHNFDARMLELFDTPEL